MYFCSLRVRVAVIRDMSVFGEVLFLWFVIHDISVSAICCFIEVCIGGEES